MASDDKSKVVINLATGHEDAERVQVAFLVGVAAAEGGRDTIMFLTKEAVRLGLPGTAESIELDAGPPVSKLFGQFAEAGGELYVCPVCFDARGLDADTLLDNAKLAGASPLWEWVGEGATVFSY